MEKKFNRHSMRKIKRAIREKQQLSRNTWKSLSAEQMERTAEYFVFYTLRKKGRSNAVPSNSMMNTYCNDLPMCERVTLVIFGRDFHTAFGIDFPSEFDARPDQLLSEFIAIVAKYAVKAFGNKKQSV